jgi:hypothetical protein
VTLVLDVLENLPDATLFSQLKALNFQWIEKLHHMGDLGDLGNEKPSELLASNAEALPHGPQGKQNVFLSLFLKGLPTKLRVLLGDDKEADPVNLSVKTDWLLAMQAHKQVRSCGSE